MKNRTIPITIAIKSDMLTELDSYLIKAGTNRSAFITELIAQRLADIVSTTETNEKETNHG